MDNLLTAAAEGSRERRTLVLLALGCGLLILGGVAVRTIAPEPATPPVVTLGDVSEADIVEIRDHRGTTVFSGEFRTRLDLLGNTEKDAALFDRRGRAVIGEVEIEIPAAGRSDRLPELEVDVIGLPPNENFTVVIDDRIVGRFGTDDRGSVDMELQEGESTSPAPSF